MRGFNTKEVVFEVEMNAFMDGQIREVTVPWETFETLETTEQVLEAVFKWGQNDYQPQDMCSVSMGDVIRLSGFDRRGVEVIERYEVAMFGFDKLYQVETKSL
jgi:hypothetical protein